MQPEPSPQRRGGLNLTHLTWLLPIAAIGVALRKPTHDNSYLWHVEAGVRQIDLGSVLTKDPFTFTARGMPWRTQSWLMELAYGWFERLGSLASADVVVAASAIVLLLAVGLRVGKGRAFLAPLAVFWVMWLTLGFFTARPVFPSLALFAVVVLVADHDRLRWTLPLLFWVWASIHGGFIVGLGYLILQGLRMRDRRFAVDALVSAGAVTLTAHGWGVWGILSSFAFSSGNLDLITEWRPPDLISIAWFPFLIGIVVLLFVGAWGRLERRDLWVIVPFLIFAFSANRAVPLAAIVVVPFVFPANEMRFGRSKLNQAVAWAAAVVILLLPIIVPVDSEAFQKNFPVAAAKELEHVPTFHSDATGGYLIYEGFDYVFIDDRAELFGPLYQRFGEALSAKPGWEGLFEEYGIQQALLKNTDSLFSVLTAERWSTRFADDVYVVLEKPATG